MLFSNCLFRWQACKLSVGSPLSALLLPHNNFLNWSGHIKCREHYLCWVLTLLHAKQILYHWAVFLACGKDSALRILSALSFSPVTLDRSLSSEHCVLPNVDPKPKICVLEDFFQEEISGSNNKGTVGKRNKMQGAVHNAETIWFPFDSAGTYTTAARLAGRIWDGSAHMGFRTSSGQLWALPGVWVPFLHLRPAPPEASRLWPKRPLRVVGDGSWWHPSMHWHAQKVTSSLSPSPHILLQCSFITLPSSAGISFSTH